MSGYSNSSKKKAYQKKKLKRRKKHNSRGKSSNEVVETFKKRYGLNLLKKEKKANIQLFYVNMDEKFVEKVLDAYELGITTSKNRIISLKFFEENRESANIPKNYAWEISALKWLTDKKNEKTLINKNKKFLESKFGQDALTNYSVPHKMRINDAPKPIPSRTFEKYVFMHDDNFFDAMVNAPKLPIEGWNKIESKGGNNKYARRVVMNIDGQVLLGEIIKFETKQPSIVCPDERSGSSTSFNVYYRGKQDGKFNIERWDYLPLAIHKNKLDEKGDFSIFGNVPKNTIYGHRHMFTFRQRLIFGKNNSADVRPLPISENLNEEEKVYGSFDKFFEAFENRINFVESKINHYELEHEGLQYFAEKYCPVYSSEEKRIVSIPKDFKDMAYHPDKVYGQMELKKSSLIEDLNPDKEEEKER